MWVGSAEAGLQLNLQGSEQAEQAASSSCGNDENGVLQCDRLSDAQVCPWYIRGVGVACAWYRHGACTRPRLSPLPGYHPSQFNVALGSREWFNSNRGGASVLEVTSTVEEGGGGGPVVMLTVFTGRLAAPLKPGERLKLSWRLLLTPVRNLDPSPSPNQPQP